MKRMSRSCSYATSTCRPTSTAALRHNRRKTKGIGRIAARVIEELVARPARTMRALVDETKRCRWFGTAKSAPA